MRSIEKMINDIKYKNDIEELRKIAIQAIECLTKKCEKLQLEAKNEHSDYINKVVTGRANYMAQEMTEKIRRENERLCYELSDANEKILEYEYIVPKFEKIKENFNYEVNKAVEEETIRLKIELEKERDTNQKWKAMYTSKCELIDKLFRKFNKEWENE